MSGAPQTEPLHVLREYRHLAPWNLRDLSVLVGAVLDASSITPINAAARAIFMPCSPVWVTQPAMTSSTWAGSTPARVTTSRRVSASRSSGRTGLSLPPRRPIAVRTASTMTASVM